MTRQRCAALARASPKFWSTAARSRAPATTARVFVDRIPGRDHRPHRDHPLADRRHGQPGHRRHHQHHPQGRRQPAARHHYARGRCSIIPDDNTFKGSGAVSLSGRNKAETVAYSLTVDAQQRYNPKLTRQEVFDDDVARLRRTATTGVDLFRPFDRDGSIAVERTEELDTRRSFDLSFNGDITFQSRRAKQASVRRFLYPHAAHRHRADARPERRRMTKTIRCSTRFDIDA